MLFKRINRDSPEQVFIVMRANDANVTADSVVGLETVAASVDGVRIVRTPTAVVAAHATVGVADAAIANGAYGLVQIYGYRSTSRVIQTSAIALGVALRAESAQVHFSSVASTAGVVPIAVLLESIASSSATATVSRKIFIRAMLVLLALGPALM